MDKNTDEPQKKKKKAEQEKAASEEYFLSDSIYKSSKTCKSKLMVIDVRIGGTCGGGGRYARKR